MPLCSHSACSLFNTRICLPSWISADTEKPELEQFDINVNGKADELWYALSFYHIQLNTLKLLLYRESCNARLSIFSLKHFPRTIFKKLFYFLSLCTCLKMLLQSFEHRYRYSLKALLLNYRYLPESYSCPQPSHTYKSLVNLISTWWGLHLFCLSRGPTMQLPVTRTHWAQI